ncbi:MAG: hypothetical protein IKV90_10380, partial [Clostridia bacterium]|nr:hypothetical protein [Clostridia bacterium]
MKILRENKWLRKISLFVLDVALILSSIYISMELRFEMYIPYNHAQTMMQSLPVLLAIYMGCNTFGGIYQIMWRYAGVRDVARLGLLNSIACALSLAANAFFNMGLF